MFRPYTICRPNTKTKISRTSRQTHRRSVFFFLHVAIRNSLRSNNVCLTAACESATIVNEVTGYQTISATPISFTPITFKRERYRQNRVSNPSRLFFSATSSVSAPRCLASLECFANVKNCLKTQSDNQCASHLSQLCRRMSDRFWLHPPRTITHTTRSNGSVDRAKTHAARQIPSDQ